MKNRWLIALAAVGIHVSIGSVYAYSVLRLPLFDQYGWTEAVKLAFPLAIVFLGLSAALMGHFVERFGPRLAGMVAAVFYGGGILGSGLACAMAAFTLQPTLALPTDAPAVQAVVSAVEQKLAHQYAALPTDDAEPLARRQALAAGLARVQRLEAQGYPDLRALLADQVAYSREANTAIRDVAPDDAEAFALARETAAVARDVKDALVAGLLSPVASHWQWLFLLCYGVLGGIGLGVGYIAPVSTLVKWFPDRRGLATGLAIMGFGFASLIFSPIMQYLIDGYSPTVMFVVLGSVYLVVMLAAASYLAPPPAGWMPDGYEAKIQRGDVTPVRDLSQLTANEAVRTRRFAYLWFMLFINVTCGIALLSVASPMAQEMVGLSPAQAAVMVGLIGLFNGVGRLGWASASDVLGRANTYIIFFVIQIAAFLLLPQVVAYALLFQILIFAIMTCYGGGFASIPAFIGDVFGTRQLGAIHGYVLTAWAAAGLAGPLTVNMVKQWTGDYTLTLLIFAGLFGVALVVAVLMKLDIARLRRQMAPAPVDRFAPGQLATLEGENA